MSDTKLTVRVSKHLLEGAKRYARQHDTTLTRLVTSYLEAILVQADLLPDAPIVRRLSGILSSDVSVEDYHAYLEKKYAGSAQDRN